jgi:hypothetical protein
VGPRPESVDCDDIPRVICVRQVSLCTNHEGYRITTAEIIGKVANTQKLSLNWHVALFIVGSINNGIELLLAGLAVVSA